LTFSLPAYSIPCVSDGRARNLARRIVARAIALALVAIATFAILEVGFRAYEAFGTAAEPTTWAIYDEDLGYRLRPGVDGVNEDGFRDDPIERPKRRFRLLMLGDSVAYYGDGPADTYPGRLESLLARAPGIAPVEVVNTAVRGYTNYQEAEFLEHYGVALEPDLVGISFCLNDLHRFTHQFAVRGHEAVGEAYHFTDEAIRSVHSPLYRLARKSHVLVFLRQRLSVFDEVVEFAVRGGYTFDYRPDFANAWQDEPWEAVARQMAKMRDLSNEHGFGMFLVVFPFGDQLRPQYLARDRAYVTKPQRRLGEICAALDIPLLDLFDAIDPERHLLDDRIHLTPLGRRHAAERIARFLIDRNLLPERG